MTLYVNRAMTSLAKQLERLAVPVVQPVGGVDTRRVSLLFNPTEAANLDREAVYCLGRLHFSASDQQTIFCCCLMK